MNLGAEFSPCLKYRYRLWRHWGRTGVTLTWIMLNPSTADELVDDPTIKRCIGYSLNMGFSGCQILNIFAWRATDPNQLLLQADPVGPENDRYISEAAQAGGTIVCAWGNVHKQISDRAPAVLKILSGADLRCLKITAHGNPWHPLYLSHKLPLIRYEIPLR